MLYGYAKLPRHCIIDSKYLHFGMTYVLFVLEAKDVLIHMLRCA